MKKRKARVYFNKNLVGSRIGAYTFYFPDTKEYYNFDVRDWGIDFHGWDTLHIGAPTCFGVQLRKVDKVVGEFIAPCNGEYVPTWTVRE